MDQLLLDKLGSIEEGSVFDEMIQLLNHMKNDMMSNIVSYITDDTKARSRPYRKDKYAFLVISFKLTNPPHESNTTQFA